MDPIAAHLHKLVALPCINAGWVQVSVAALSLIQLHTTVAMIAADALGVPAERVPLSHAAGFVTLIPIAQGSRGESFGILMWALSMIFMVSTLAALCVLLRR